MSTGPTDTPQDPTRVRASDAEREEYARIIREAVGEGRLALGEGDERLAKVYATRFRDELRPLVTDLPGGAEAASGYGRGAWPGSAGDPGSDAPWGGPGHGPWHGPWRGPGGPRMGGGCAGGRGGWAAGGRRGFLRHTRFVALLTAALVGVWVLTGAHLFWLAFPVTLLLLGLLRHGLWLRWARRMTPTR
jgi:uncharacterized protein DUF1707